MSAILAAQPSFLTAAASNWDIAFYHSPKKGLESIQI